MFPSSSPSSTVEKLQWLNSYTTKLSIVRAFTDCTKSKSVNVGVDARYLSVNGRHPYGPAVATGGTTSLESYDSQAILEY